MSDKSDPEGTLPRHPDEKYIFVKKGTPSELILPLQTAGRRANCRGRGIQFSSGIFPIGYNFPDPLLIAASFANLEFSYRIIPLRRIRFAWCLTAGAKFSSRNKKARDAGFVTGKKKKRFSWRKSLRCPVTAQICHGSGCSVVWIHLREMRLGLRLIGFNGKLWPSFAEWQKWTSFRKW